MLKNNKLNLLISIVAAVVLWAYITTVVNPVTERAIGGISVELVNTPALNDRGFTVNEGVSYSVDVTVSGPRSEVVKLTPKDFRATADVTGYRKGDHEVPVTVFAPADIELLQVRMATVTVHVVDLITVNKPVRLEFEDQFEKGEEPGFVQIIPEEMEVSGVADAVDSVDYIRAIIPKGALTEEAQSMRVDVFAIDKEGRPVNNVGLSQNSVEVIAARCATKQVPLNVEIIGNPNENVKVTDTNIPSYITIRGSKAAIEDITEVDCQAVDLSSITNTIEIPINPYLPNGVEVAEASKNLVIQIEVQGIIKKEFEYTGEMIEIENLLSEFTGHVNTGSVVVTVFAFKDIVTQMTPDDIKLSVDAANFNRVGDSVEMEVKAECELEIKSIEVKPVKVRVSIFKAD